MTGQQWSPVCLGDYCSKIGSGSTPRGGESVYHRNGVSFIRSQNVYNGQFAIEGLAYIDEAQADQLKGVTIEKGDVLLNITGDSVARSCMVPEDILPARVNQHVAIIRLRPEDFNSYFVGYFFISPFMQKTMLSLAGSGGTRNALTKEMIERFEVPKPPLPVQERIADLLSAYDNLIENNHRRSQLLEESAHLLYQEWFVRLRFPGYEHTPIVDGVPAGWEPNTLGDLCFEVREIVNPSELEPDTPYIGLEHIPRRSICLDTWGRAEEVTSTKHKYITGDIIFGKIRPYFHKVGIAFTDGIASSDAIVMRPITENLRSLLLLTASSDGFVAVASKTAREGSKMPRADWNLMKQYHVPIPPEGMLDAFNGTVVPIVEQLKLLAFQNQKLKAARDLLLPRLMSGEIAV